MLLFIVLYVITYKIYNLKANNLLFLFLLCLLLIQGIYLTYHNKFSYYKYFYDILRYITFIGLFLFGKFAYNNISRKGLVIWFLIVIFYHITTGYMSLILGDASVIYQNIRLSGEFGNAGQFGLLMGLSFILLLLIIKNTGDLLHKIFMFITIMLIAILLAYNNTMRIIVSLFFAFFMYYIVYKKKYIYFIIISLALITLLLINREIYFRLSNLLTANYDVSGLGSGGIENSFQWRVMQWYLLITDWFNNYLLMGVGLGQQTFLHGFIAPWGEPYVAHSDFVKLLVETGLLGFPVVIYLYYWLYKYLRNNCYMEEFILVFLFFLFCLLTGNTLFSNPMQIFVFLIGYFTMEKQGEYDLK